MGVPLGRYVLDRRIAQGGMGEVHLARQTGPDGFERVCVVKTMHDAMASDPECVGLFLEEARLSAQLTHANIAQVYDFGKEGDAYYLAMEYVDGPSVRDIIRGHRSRGRPTDPGPALRIVSQVAQALDYVHRLVGPDGMPLDLVHRDISPGNLLVSKDGVVKIIDFGIAKARTTQRQTQIGTVRGKLAYVAPEQMFSLPIDARADIFSLGLVLYELLSLRRAFRGKTDLELFEAARTWNIMPLNQARPDLPPAVTSVVLKATRRDPADRFQSAGEFAEAIEAALGMSRLVVMPSHLKALAVEFADVAPTGGDSDPRTPSGSNPKSGGSKATPAGPSGPRPSAPSAAAARAPTTPTGAEGAQDVAPPQPEPTMPAGAAALTVSPPAASGSPANTVPDLPGVDSEPQPGRSTSERTVIAARPGPPPSKLRVPYIFAGVGLLVVLAAVVAWTMSHGDPAPPDPSLPAPLAAVSGARPSPTTPGGDPAEALPEDRGVPPVEVAPPPLVEPPAFPLADADVSPPTGNDAVPVVVAGDETAAEEEAPDGTDTDEEDPAGEDPLVDSADPGAPPTQRVATGVLEVTSVPPLEVLVDGRSRGTTPKKLKVSAGLHRVTWRSKKLGLSRKVSVRVTERSPAKLDWSPRQGTVEVRAVPPHVELQISLDGRAVGATPLAALQVWEGAHVVAARNAATGWRAQLRVVLPPGGKLALKVYDGGDIKLSDK